MSRMFEGLVASLSPNPPCSRPLKCYIHALMRDQITTVELNSVLDRLINLFCFHHLIDLCPSLSLRQKHCGILVGDVAGGLYCAGALRLRSGPAVCLMKAN